MPRRSRRCARCCARQETRHISGIDAFPRSTDIRPSAAAASSTAPPPPPRQPRELVLPFWRQPAGFERIVGDEAAEFERQIVQPIVECTGRSEAEVWREQFAKQQAQSPCLRSSRDVRLGLERLKLSCGQHHLRPLQPVLVRVRPRRDCGPATQAIAREKGVRHVHFLPDSEAAFETGLLAKAQKWEQRYMCICGTTYEEMLLVARSDDIARQSREVYHEIRRKQMIEEERKEQEREEAIQRKRQRGADLPAAEPPLGLPSEFDGVVRACM